MSSGSPKLRTRSQPDVGGDHAEHRLLHDRLAVVEHAVHDVLHGPVVPDRHEEPAPVVERRRRQTRGVPGGVA